MENDFKFIKAKFKENLKKYKSHFKVFNAIEDFEIKWSNSYTDFFSYSSRMNGYKPPKLYNEKPLSDEGIIQNRFKNNEIYYSFQYSNKEWGTEFYLTDEQNNKMRLFYENQNEDEKMLLSQFDYKVMNGNVIDKVFCYMYDSDMEEETFYIYEYFYVNDKISKIIRIDYFDMDTKMIFNENDLNK